MSQIVADVIDAVLGVSEGSPLDRLRAQRPEARARTQSSYAALFDPSAPGRLTAAERFAVAVRVADLNDAEGLAAHYRARLDAEKRDAGSTSRVAAMLRHAERVTLNPSAASRDDLATLAANGLSPAEIVKLSQIVAFVAYQVRVAASLALIAETP